MASILDTFEAPNSNLRPFDVEVPEGTDPIELAKKLANEKRSVLDTFEKPPGYVEPKPTPIPAIKPTGSRKSALDTFFEKGAPAWAAPLIPGQGMSMEMPEGGPEWEVDKDLTPLKTSKVMLVRSGKGSPYKYHFENVQELTQGEDKPNFVERAIDAITGLFGAKNVRSMSEGAKAQAVITVMAKEAGVPVDQFRQSPEFMEKLASSFVSTSTFGLAPAIKNALTGEVDFGGESLGGYVGQAVGSLAGLYAGPLVVAGKVMGPVLNRIPTAFQEEALTARIMKSVLRDSVLLGPALGAANVGEALKQVTFTQAKDKIWEGVNSGAAIGALFGASRGIFPKEGVQTGMRIFTGLVGLNTYRAAEMGGNPFTDRPVGQVMFDILFDAAFLWKGLPKGMRFEVSQDLTDLNEKINKVKQMEAEVEGIPDETLKAAQAKVLEMEKIQLDLEAKRIAEKSKAAVEAKVELGVNKEKIDNIKEGKDAEGEVEVAEDGKEIVPKLNELEKPTELEKVNVLDTFEKAEGDTTVPEKAPDKKKTIVRKKKVKEPITPLDEATGTKRPEALLADRSPFRNTNKEQTEARFKAMNVKGGVNSPETATQFFINEVNRWLNGEDSVDIEKTRNALSTAAARADEWKGQFDNTQYFNDWKVMVTDAAKWARGADRSGIKRTGGGTQLNMMIPVNELPEVVKGLMKDIKAGMQGLYRNREIWDKTGFWLGRDGKWRYEIDDYINIYDNENKVRMDYGILRDGKPRKLPEVYMNEKLYEAVPELRNISIVVDPSIKQGSSGYYSSGDKTIHQRFSSDRETTLHETQHAVNDIVGSKFRGSNVQEQEMLGRIQLFKQLRDTVKDPEIKKELTGLIYEAPKSNKSVHELTYDLRQRAITKSQNDFIIMEETINDYLKTSAFDRYMKDPGEMEARLASKRMDMTAEERKAEPPWETLDKMLSAEEFTRLNTDMSDAEVKAVQNRMSKTGSTLYSGIDPTQIPEATRRIIEGAKRLAAYTANARGMKKFNLSAAAKMLNDNFVRSFIDRSGNIRKELLDQLGPQGYEIVQKMVLSKGASSMSANMLKQMSAEVYDGLSKNEKRILDNLILADRMLDIGKYKTAKEFKFPEGLTPIESAAYNELFQYIEKITPEQATLLKQRAKAYFEWMKVPLKDMLDAELISQEEYDALSSHNYRRLKLVDIFDKRYTAKTGKTKRTVYDSGVEALAHGRETDVFEPSSEIMALEVFNRAYGRIMNNAANKELLSLARTDKENPFVRVKETPRDKIPTGWDRVFVYEQGERKAIYLSPEMSKEWITNSPEMSYKLSQFLRYASGSPILRTFATGIDWGFALANLPRDIMHTWFTARTFEDGKWKGVYNPTLPIFGLQMAKDQISVFSDAMNRKGRYLDYIKEGGGMEFLVHQGRLMQRGRHIEDGIDKVQNVLGYFGETSEILTRLAIRERAIRNGKSQQEATFAARDYMDFGQGGGIAKAMDNAVPYLNASIQGTRGLFRTFKDNPLISTYKLAQFGALVTGLYIANQALNPETMESLKGNIDMQNNLVLPLGDEFSFIDSKGQTRYPYFKIPIDPGQKFFKTFFEASTDKWLGNELDVEAVTNSLTQVSPIGISSLPPTVASTLGYVTNKDFWLNEDIWKKTDKPLSWPNSKEEYIPGQTNQAFIDVGKATGLSPERTKYAVEQLVTGGSMWSYLVGQGYDVMFGELPKDQKEKHLAEVLAKVPIAKRFFGVTNPYSQFAQPIEKAKEDSSLQTFVENRGLDTLVDGYLYKGNVKEAEINEYIRKAKDVDTFERLRDRYKFSVQIKDLSNRSFWLALKGIPDAEARAKVFVDRYDKASVKEREAIDRELGIVQQAGGVVSDSFKVEVGKLRNK